MFYLQHGSKENNFCLANMEWLRGMNWWDTIVSNGKQLLYHQNKGQNVLISGVYTTSFWQNKTISFVNFIFAPCILTNTPLPHLYFKICNITPVMENFPSSCITTFFLVRLHCYYFLKFIQGDFIEKIIHGSL